MGVPRRPYLGHLNRKWGLPGEILTRAQWSTLRNARGSDLTNFWSARSSSLRVGTYRPHVDPGPVLLYRYVAGKAETGMNPYVAAGHLTLGTCMPGIRRSARERDWVLVYGPSKNRQPGALIWVFQVTEKIPFVQYMQDHGDTRDDALYYEVDDGGSGAPRLARKQGGRFAEHHQEPGDLIQDAGGEFVLWSDRFAVHPQLPDDDFLLSRDFRHSGRGYKYSPLPRGVSIARCVSRLEELAMCHELPNEAIAAEQEANANGSGGWLILQQPGMGLGLMYMHDVPKGTPKEDCPRCNYQLTGGALCKVAKAGQEDCAYLLGDAWAGDDDDEQRAEFAYKPARNGAAAYANDGTVVYQDNGTWKRSNIPPNARHLHDQTKKGHFEMALKPKFKAGWVSVAYGSGWWDETCKAAMERADVQKSGVDDPSWCGEDECGQSGAYYQI